MSELGRITLAPLHALSPGIYLLRSELLVGNKLTKLANEPLESKELLVCTMPECRELLVGTLPENELLVGTLLGS